VIYALPEKGGSIDELEALASESYYSREYPS